MTPPTLTPSSARDPLAVPEPVLAYHGNSGGKDSRGLPARSSGGGEPGGMPRYISDRIAKDRAAGFRGRVVCHLFVTPRVEPPLAPMRRDGGMDAIEQGLDWMVRDGWEAIFALRDAGFAPIVYNGTEDARLRDLAAADPAEYVRRVWPSYGPGIGQAGIAFGSDAYPHLSPGGLMFDAVLEAMGHTVYAEPWDPMHRRPVILEEWWYDANRLNNPAARAAIDAAPEVLRWLNASSADSRDPEAWLRDVAAAGHTPVIQTYREFEHWTRDQVVECYREARARALLMRDRDGDGRVTAQEILANAAEMRARQADAAKAEGKA